MTTAARKSAIFGARGTGSKLRQSFSRMGLFKPSRLSREQLQLIPDIFSQGAVIHGFPDNRWTTARLAAIIEARFGVRYDHDHVGRLMQKLGLREARRRAAPVSDFRLGIYPSSSFPENLSSSAV